MSLKFERDSFRGQVPMDQMSNMSNYVPNAPSVGSIGDVPNMGNPGNMGMGMGNAPSMPNYTNNMGNMGGNMPTMANVPSATNMPHPASSPFVGGQSFDHVQQSGVGAAAATGGMLATKGRDQQHHHFAAIRNMFSGKKHNETTTSAVGYLASYLKELEDHPLRTKMLTAGSLAGLQELLASWLAKDRNKHNSYLTARIPKMAAYGAFISAPLGHLLIWLLQRAFAGRTSLKAKILQIFVSNLVIAPIQNSVYLVAMALIAGARTYHQVRATVKVGFWRVMRISWITSPICLAFAQKFLPEQAWVPFFNVVAFVIGTYINTHTKKKRLAALRKKHFGDGSGGTHIGGGHNGSSHVAGPSSASRAPRHDDYPPVGPGPAANY